LIANSINCGSSLFSFTSIIATLTGQPESSRSGTARIEKNHPIAHFHGRFMGVAENHATNPLITAS
jgi:hypothetical protein